MIPRHTYCPSCGSAALDWRVPAGDDRERQVCPDCGDIHYANPRNVAGCIAEHAGRILLCRRAIEPRYGYWTVPAGFMEEGESLAEAAARETYEEACARTGPLMLYAVYSLPHISQVYALFRTEIPDGKAAAGIESLEVDWFEEQQIPWGELAFPVIEQGLRLYCDDRRQGHFPVRTGDIRRREDGILEIKHDN